MKIITHNDITNLKIDCKLCYQWVSEAIRFKGEGMLKPKISISTGTGVFYNTMFALLPFINRAGVKLVNRNPQRTPSLDSQILLYDIETSDCIALLDGNWITTMRTAAVAVHSMNLFAKSAFSTMSFIGLGNTARSTMLVFLALHPDRKVTVKLKKYKDQHELFEERFRDYKNISFEYCDTYDDTVRGSDIVVSAPTYLDEDICPFDSFSEGALVLPIHTRGFTCSDLYFDKIFVDDSGHVQGFKNIRHYRHFAEVCDVVNNKECGRENDQERIMVYNIGIALHDIYFAGKLYELLADKCEDHSLNPPKEKFWV